MLSIGTEWKLLRIVDEPHAYGVISLEFQHPGTYDTLLLTGDKVQDGGLELGKLYRINATAELIE